MATIGSKGIKSGRTFEEIRAEKEQKAFAALPLDAQLALTMLSPEQLAGRIAKIELLLTGIQGQISLLLSLDKINQGKAEQLRQDLNRAWDEISAVDKRRTVKQSSEITPRQSEDWVELDVDMVASDSDSGGAWSTYYVWKGTRMAAPANTGNLDYFAVNLRTGATKYASTPASDTDEYEYFYLPETFGDARVPLD